MHIDGFFFQGGRNKIVLKRYRLGFLFRLGFIRAVFIAATNAAARRLYHRAAAIGAFITRGDIPAHKLTIGITQTAIIHLTALGFADGHSRTALGAFADEFGQFVRGHRHCRPAIRVAGASEEFTRLTALNHHIFTAFGATERGNFFLALA